MRFQVFLTLLFLCLHNAAIAGNLKIESDIKGRANVYIRPSGTNQKYVKMAAEVPCEIEFESQSNQDIKVERIDYFIYSVSGIAMNVPSNKLFPVKVMTERKLLWVKIMASLLVALPLFFLNLLRKKAKSDSDILPREDALETVRDYMLGKQLGKYTLTKKIGHGGMASVYMAVDESEAIYAIKIPDEKYREGEMFPKRFAHEAIIASKLIHKSIVRVFDYCLDSGKIPFICMEYAKGEVLSDVLKKEPRQSAQMAVKYITEILNALSYAHGQNIFHRDIKPSNIMVSDKNEIKLMDFGIAKATELSVITATDTILGTPVYIAPEQIDGKHSDGRSDLYAVGVIFYEMLAGRPPFLDQDPIKIIMMKHTQTPPRPSIYNAEILPAYEKIIMKLIEKEPQDRYATCEDVIRDIVNLPHL